MKWSRSRSRMLWAGVAAVVTFALVALMVSQLWLSQQSEELPDGLRLFSAPRHFRLTSPSGELSGNWAWAVCKVVELRSGEHVIPVMTIRRPRHGGMGMGEFRDHPIWVIGAGMQYVHLPMDEDVGRIHLLVTRFEIGTTYGRDNWKVLSLKREEIEDIEVIRVPPLESLPELESLGVKAEWDVLIDTALSFQRNRSR